MFFPRRKSAYNIAVSEHHLHQKKNLSLIYISFPRELPTIIIFFLNSQISISLNFLTKNRLSIVYEKCNYLSILRIVFTSLDNLSKKLHLKFQVNLTKIERFTMYANSENIVSRKTHLKFQNTFTIWNIQNIDLLIFLTLLCYPSTI